MPRREDITSVLVIGSGPIVIGQACEFDYSGTQACRVLRDEGIRVVLVNSNPATIMTDPEFADATYVEPITPEIVEAIIAKERPDAVLATLGGQTALNCAMALHERGVLERYNCPLIGANVEAIQLGEDREKFKGVVARCGAESARSIICHTMDECLAAAEELRYPVVVRPSFTMGGLGSGFAYDEADLRRIGGAGLQYSPVTEVLLEESIIGWKEYELEVMRDHKDNVVVVCSIENLDPMGVHTGDSITVAPALTLTDREYQRLRDIGIAVIREVGVDTGGCNIQFAVNPDDGRIIVIEMNPRVSRSSALASKATGFPIAKIAAKLAVGYTLDELANDITGGKTPASFEPSIDYVVTKVPRFAFEKFPQADSTLTTQMKSVGEVMAIGRTFQESLQKALRGLEVGVDGFNLKTVDPETIDEQLARPTPDRLWYIADAFGVGMTVDKVFDLTRIDPWFLVQIKELVDLELEIEKRDFWTLTAEELRFLKRKGFADRRLAHLTKTTETAVRQRRHELNVRPVYKRVDTCAAEFSTDTAYMYSTYEDECEANPTDKRKIMVLGGGPNRIGQGIEFDYCCVHAAMAMREDGYETIMVNCNPETVSTDYDTSDRLYFEPLTLEDVLEIVAVEKPLGVIVQYGGQTPLKLALALEANGVPIIGTTPESIDIAEDRERFQKLLHELGLKQPPNRTARPEEDALRLAAEIGSPLMLKASWGGGGRGMRRIMDESTLISDLNQLAADVETLARSIKDSSAATPLHVNSRPGGLPPDALLGGIHLYSPLLHMPDGAGPTSRIKISPVALKDSEFDFVRDLHAHLLENQSAFAGKEFFLLRNKARGGGIGFFEAGSFYPNFILWIIDGDRQQIVFIEPHGLIHEGIASPKVQFCKVIKDIEKRLGDDKVSLSSFIVSPTQLSSLQRNFGLHSLEEFLEINILFMKNDSAYVGRLLEKACMP